MKKVIALILLFVIMASMSATAFAEETATEDPNSQAVLASYEASAQGKPVISVDISWEQMSFTYKDASAPAWNAEEHRYEGEETEAGWVEGNGIITISNNSNALLQACISYDPEEKFDTVSMSFTDTAPYLGSAHTDDRLDEEGEVIGTPCEVTIKVIPVGVLAKETGANTRIGTITISIKSDVDVFDMLDELGVEVGKRAVAHPAGLERGKVYMVSGAVTDNIYTLLDEASVAYADAQKTPAEKNVAINKALVAFYGALNIVQ